MPTPYVEPYPRWYTPVKWLIPIVLGLSAGTLVSFSLMGIIPISASFGKLAWLPAIYKSLEGIKAMAVLGGAFSLVGSFVGVSTAFVLRATVLFHENEKRGTQAQLAQHEIDKSYEVIEDLMAQNKELQDRLGSQSDDHYFINPVLPSRRKASSSEDEELEVVSDQEKDHKLKKSSLRQ